MPTEKWKDIAGWENLYQVSILGRVKSLSFLQRYLLRTGAPALRRTKERILKCRPQNAGYPVVQLWRGNKAHGRLVHRLVAEAFVPGRTEARNNVNHIDGVKTNFAAGNLEWVTSSRNHFHAVEKGLNKQAKPYGGYGSIAQAAKALGKAHRTIRAERQRV